MHWASNHILDIVIEKGERREDGVWKIFVVVSVSVSKLSVKVVMFDLQVSMIKEERNDNIMIACFSKKWI